MAVSDYSTTADQNTTISGINIAEGCPPSGINNAIRQMMADIKSKDDAQDTDIDSRMPKSGGTFSGGITAEWFRTSINNHTIAPYWGDDNQLHVVIDSTDFRLVKSGECLPLSGGKMTGDLKFGGVIGFAPSETELIGKSALDDDKHSLLTVRNGNHEDPGFIIRAGNGVTWKDLLGRPDGTLAWNGSTILTSANTNTSNLVRFLNSHTIGLYWNDSGFPVMRVDSTDFVLARTSDTVARASYSDVLTGVVCGTASSSFQLPGYGSWAGVWMAPGPYFASFTAAGGSIVDSGTGRTMYYLAVRYA